MNLLEVNDVVSGYGKIEVLHGVSLLAKEKDITCVIGPNGSGKSTLLKTIIGLIRPREGEISFNGEAIAGLKPPKILAKGLCLVSQARSIFPNLTVLENLNMGAYTIKDRNEVGKRIEQVYTYFPILKERRKSQAYTLSGGEQRMLELGRALLVKPKMLMLDEPSAMLAPILVDRIFEEIKKINEMGIGIIFVEQNVRKAISFADYVYVLERGKNIFDGNPESFLDSEKLVSLYLGG